jgi:hypothetical protein
MSGRVSWRDADAVDEALDRFHNLTAGAVEEPGQLH